MSTEVLHFSVDGCLPPKKDGASSMWNKAGNRRLLVALRAAAANALGGREPFDEPVALELVIRTAVVGKDLGGRRTRGDLDNFITGVCDGLQAAHPGSTRDLDWPELPDRAVPSQPLALTDDSWVVKIVASFAEGPVGYDVVVGPA